MHCTAQVLNELTEVKELYQFLCSEDSLEIILKSIESKDPDSQKFSFWVLGYLALKFDTHQTLAQRTSIINDDEEINMLDDEPTLK